MPVGNATGTGVGHARGLNHRQDVSPGFMHHHSDHHTVFAHQEYRTPMLSDVTECEVVCCITFHNDTSGLHHNYDAHANSSADWCPGTARTIRNYYKKAPASGVGPQKAEESLSAGWLSAVEAAAKGLPPCQVYTQGIISSERLTEADPELDGNGRPVWLEDLGKNARQAGPGINTGPFVFQNTDPTFFPYPTFPITMEATATAAYNRLIVNYASTPEIGATRTCSSTGTSVVNPDATDRRVMAEVLNNWISGKNTQVTTGASSFIDDPLQAILPPPWNQAPPAGFDIYGYPILDSNAAPIDSDGDGIPDNWAAANMPGGKTALDVSPNGYLYIELYLNELAGDTSPPPPPPGSTISSKLIGL